MNKKIIEKGFKKWEDEQLVGKIEEVDDLRRRVKALEDKVSDTREDALKSESRLKDLIAEAVSKGNESIMTKIEEMKKDVDMLKNAEANRALEQKKNTYSLIKTTAITMIAGYVIMAMFTNGVAIISEALKTSNEKEMNVNEVSKTVE